MGLQAELRVHVVLFLGVDLKPAPGGVGDDDAVFRVHRQPDRSLEQPHGWLSCPSLMADMNWPSLANFCTWLFLASVTRMLSAPEVANELLVDSQLADALVLGDYAARTVVSPADDVQDQSSWRWPSRIVV